MMCIRSHIPVREARREIVGSYMPQTLIKHYVSVLSDVRRVLDKGGTRGIPQTIQSSSTDHTGIDVRR